MITRDGRASQTSSTSSTLAADIARILSTHGAASIVHFKGHRNMGTGTWAHKKLACRRSNDRVPALKQPETQISATPRLGAASIMRQSFQLLSLETMRKNDGADRKADKRPADKRLRGRRPTAAANNMSSAKTATAQVQAAERRRRRASHHPSSESAGAPHLAAAQIKLQWTVHQAHDALDLVVQGLTVASLRARPWLIARVLDLKLRSLAPSLRVALGDMLQRVRHVGGWRLNGGWRINVELNDHQNSSLWTNHVPHHDQKDDHALWNEDLTEKEQEAAHEMVQVLSLRVYPKGLAPTLKKFGETFADVSDSSSDEGDGDESEQDDSDDDIPNMSGLYIQRTLKRLPVASSKEESQPPHIPQCPKEWENERHLVVKVSTWTSTWRCK